MDNSINYEQLAQAVKERRESSPEFQNASHQEVLSNVLHEHRNAAPEQDDGGSSFAKATADKQGQNDGLASYATDAPQDAKQKTENLIQFTFEHGLSAGLSKALHEDPFILDLYHDTLTEKLYNEMKNRNLL